MTPQEHLAEIRAMTDEERDAIERQMLIEMAERYGGVQEAHRERVRAAARRASKRAKEKSA